VSGECSTVGLAGGYTRGGGHSALMSKYGLGADQVLEWEVVTADGKLCVANRKRNNDLYWALSGGGTYEARCCPSISTKLHRSDVFNVCFTGSFSLGPFFGPGLTKADTAEILQLIDKLEELGLPYTYNVTVFWIQVCVLFKFRLNSSWYRSVQRSYYPALNR
jgi:hypothetical protein